jgi:hypothetical protein
MTKYAGAAAPLPFADAISEAAAQNDHGRPDRSAPFPGDASQTDKRHLSNLIEVQAEANAAFASAAEKIREERGVAVIWRQPRVGRKRCKAEYTFWRTPITSFIEFPDTLDLGPTALALRYGPSEPNFVVTKDTFRAPLSEPARKEARKLLGERGYTLQLPAVFSIRDVQKAMKDHRDRADGLRRFRPKVEIVGDTVYCDGKAFKMQSTGSGKLRIRAGGGWLPLNALIGFLSGVSAKNTER